MGKKDQYLKRLAVGGTLAAGAGYLAGILTAPRSGKQTRIDIKAAAEKGRVEAEKELKVLNTELTKTITEAKSRSKKLSTKAQAELQELLVKATDTKEKAREIISAIHDGDAEDQDLKRAVKNANSALEHLKDFLDK